MVLYMSTLAGKTKFSFVDYLKLDCGIKEYFMCFLKKKENPINRKLAYRRRW